MSRAVPATGPAFDVHAVRADFPILETRVHGRPLAYLDNAATTQKPRAVVDRMAAYYLRENANVHRGVHQLSERATEAFESARRTIARFINAADAREVIFTRGTTEAVNLVAASYGRTHVGSGDEILLTAMEHHSNIVPWQMLAEAAGARVRVVPMTDAGELRVDEYERLLSDRTRLVAVVHVSNALGTVNPVDAIVRLAHARGVPVLVDGAQAVAHMAVDVRALDCDFYAFSGHKVFGPTGIGVLYGKASLLDAMPPYQGGGDMISSVSFERTTYNALPYKFEAGTPHIAGAVGLAAALEYVTAIGHDRIQAYEHELLEYGTALLERVPGLTITGTAPGKAAVLAFVMDGIHPHDIGTVLDREGVAIRTGHHCCQPLMDRLGVPATARASLAFYNTRAELDALAAGLEKVRQVFG
jgi:cysteine desulfurase/selenocysteine lyase